MSFVEFLLKRLLSLHTQIFLAFNLDWGFILLDQSTPRFNKRVYRRRATFLSSCLFKLNMATNRNLHCPNWSFQRLGLSVTAWLKESKSKYQLNLNLEHRTRFAICRDDPGNEG
jgi:hypothetical protein